MVANTLINGLVLSLREALFWRDTTGFVATRVIKCYLRTGLINAMLELSSHTPPHGREKPTKLVYEESQYQKRSIDISITGNSAQN